MSFVPLLLALTLTSGHSADIAPSCEARLADIRDARLTLDGLLAAERTLLRRHARARSHRARTEVVRLLGPITTQARALEEELDRQERAYLRCVEAQLDARPLPSSGARDPQPSTDLGSAVTHT